MARAQWGAYYEYFINTNRLQAENTSNKGKLKEKI